jgi:hypothetical protein
MAESTIQTDSGNFEDFEKLDPLMPSMNMNDDFVSSSSPVSADDPFSSPPPAADDGAKPLLDMDDFDPMAMGKAPEPAFQPDSSTPAPAKEPTPPPAPVEKSEPAPKKPVVSTGGGWMKNIDPRVLELVYWRDPKKSGIVFGSMMVLLLSLALFSVLSVVAYLSLAALTVTCSFRIYKNILQAIQKTGEGHPFKQYLDCEISLPEDKVHQVADLIVKHASCTLHELRRLFLVEDLVDSLKYGLLLWVLTYIGAWFNGMTLIILAVVSAFTIPKFYETNKTQIDQYIDLARTQVKTIFDQIKEKIPLPGKKKQP